MGKRIWLIIPAFILILIVAIVFGKRQKAKKMFNKFVNDQKKKGESFTPTQLRSIMEIINAFIQYGDGDERKLSYILATAKHESKFRPVRECFAVSDSAARICVSNAGREYAAVVNGHVYYGRGFVQLTWFSNYKKMGKRLSIDLANQPDLALQVPTAAKILVVGMYEGIFTGKKLADYINANGADYFNARRIVNATDRAELIAGYSEDFETGLT